MVLEIPPKMSEVSIPPIDLIKRLASRVGHLSDIIDLGQSMSGFLPAENVIVKVRTAILDGPASLYTNDAGMPELRNELAKQLRLHSHLTIDPEDIIVTAGANNAFMILIQTLFQPGDEVILPSPYYFNHEMALRVANLSIVESPCLPDFQLDLEDIQKKITEKTKAIVLVTPNNPTGAVYTEKSLRDLAAVVAENKIAVISDETYQHFVFDGVKHFSIGSIQEIEDNVITINSFSKAHGMSGWRVGYLAANQQLIKEITKVHSVSNLCAPTVSQIAALEALQPKSLEYMDKKIRRVADLRNYLLHKLSELSTMEVVPTKGAFYVFPKVTCKHKSKNTNNLAMDIVKSAYVITVPGTAFSAKYGENHLRLTYSNVSREKLDEAIGRIDAYLKRASK